MTPLTDRRRVVRRFQRKQDRRRVEHVLHFPLSEPPVRLVDGCPVLLRVRAKERSASEIGRQRRAVRRRRADCAFGIDLPGAAFLLVSGNQLGGGGERTSVITLYR